MKIASICILTLSVVISCCSQNPVDKALGKLNLSSPQNYKMIDSTYIWGFGESYEHYRIIVSEKDFTNIKNEIKTNNSFQIIDSSSLEPNLPKDKTNIKTDIEIAYLFDERYCIEKYIPNPGISIRVALLRDSILNIEYEDF
jgi:hypothetical protein